ncbi:hypothetical protein [Chromobacterium haemolyticum]|uniref:hypothetical protein n=1 Tax=Chromobacterium haemolyticum TaxID=394935 RepID=UPI000DEF7251|nr:hypothetical protein [Chromobacterium haemolyticum]
MITRPRLEAALKASMLDSANVFKPEDYLRHIDTALEDYSRRKPLQCLGELALSVGRTVYDCPAALLTLQGLDWGRDAKAGLNPWDDRWPGRLPELRLLDGEDGRKLYLSPAPNARQLALLGGQAVYRYGTAHQLSDSASTVPPVDAALLLVRAQAEAMRELAMRNSSRPLQMQDGLTSTPKNGTPSYLYTVLIEEFERRVAL